MTKQNIFSLISFFGVIGWLEVLGVRAGFAYACFILLAMALIQIMYGFGKDDNEDDFYNQNLN